MQRRRRRHRKASGGVERGGERERAPRTRVVKNWRKPRRRIVEGAKSWDMFLGGGVVEGGGGGGVGGGGGWGGGGVE